MSDLTKHLPESPGVYLFKDARGKTLYIGKAANLKRRVSSYFQKAHPSTSFKEGDKIEKLLAETKKIDYEETDTAIEALILEAELIKRFKPLYNIREKDDQSFLYVEITNEEFPRVLLVRGKEVARTRTERAERVEVFGPFTSASSIRAALKIIRKIFPYNTHPHDKVGTMSRPCFYYEIEQCPGTCIGAVTKTEYKKTIRRIKLFFEGKKSQVLKSLEREMEQAADKLDYERAERLKRQVFALKHIQDIAFITRDELPATRRLLPIRIEGYDISNISGASAVGAMAVFYGAKPRKDQYRLFKIHTIDHSDDVGMLGEVLQRRLTHEEWQYPDVVLVDGGKAQVNAAKCAIEEAGMKIPVVGIAKGPTRKKNELVGVIPKGVRREWLIALRDEAHRFAIGYHKKVRSKKFIQ